MQGRTCRGETTRPAELSRSARRVSNVNFGKKQAKCYLGQGSSGGRLSRVPERGGFSRVPERGGLSRVPETVKRGLISLARAIYGS